MAVNTKGMRKVNFKGKPYFWNVQEVTKTVPREGGFVEPVKERWVRIIDNKKQFNVLYRIPEPRDDDALLRVEGVVFPRKPGTAEMRMPRWKHDTKRYPTNDFVRRIIEWCLTEDA
jgi:hypothetical protein